MAHYKGLKYFQHLLEIIMERTEILTVYTSCIKMDTKMDSWFHSSAKTPVLVLEKQDGSFVLFKGAISVLRRC